MLLMLLLFVRHLIWSHMGMYTMDMTSVDGMAAKRRT